MGLAQPRRASVGAPYRGQLMAGLVSLEDLGVDTMLAPGWALKEARRRMAMLVRVNDTTAWVAAVHPTDISVVDDLRWLTNRSQVIVLPVSLETLNEALAKTE